MLVPVDITNPDTWPGPALEYADRWAQRLAGTSEHPGDLDVPLEDEDRFVALLGNRPLLAYHCTRLLDAEVDAVRHDGLARLTEDLVTRKLDTARTAGAITDTQYAQLIGSTVFALDNADGRTGALCVVVGHTGLDDTNGVERLLSLWGGEAIYWAHGDDRPGAGLGSVLRTLGRPAIVSVAVDLSVGGREDSLFFPSLHKLFVGALLGLDDVNGDAHLPTGVAGHEVLDVWQPGHPQYDRHRGLPAL